MMQSQDWEDVYGTVCVRIRTRIPGTKSRGATLARMHGTLRDARAFVQEWRELNPDLAHRVHCDFEAHETL